MKKNRLYLDSETYYCGDYNTIKTSDGREIDYTHWYTGNDEPSFSCKLVYESDSQDFQVVYHGEYKNVNEEMRAW